VLLSLLSWSRVCGATVRKYVKWMYRDSGLCECKGVGYRSWINDGCIGQRGSRCGCGD
jgi:hypothetical protein